MGLEKIKTLEDFNRAANEKGTNFRKQLFKTLAVSNYVHNSKTFLKKVDENGTETLVPVVAEGSGYVRKKVDGKVVPGPKEFTFGMKKIDEGNWELSVLKRGKGSHTAGNELTPQEFNDADLPGHTHPVGLHLAVKTGNAVVGPKGGKTNMSGNIYVDEMNVYFKNNPNLTEQQKAKAFRAYLSSDNTVGGDLHAMMISKRSNVIVHSGNLVFVEYRGDSKTPLISIIKEAHKFFGYESVEEMNKAAPEVREQVYEEFRERNRNKKEESKKKDIKEEN